MQRRRNFGYRRNNLPREINAEGMKDYSRSLDVQDAKQSDSLSKRKTSASVDEIRDLYHALQELVPSQGRPPATAAYGSIPEETSTSRSARGIPDDKVDYNVVSRSSNPNPAPLFTKRYRCSSPLPVRSQPKIIQRNRSNSCFAISSSSSVAPPSANFLNDERRDSESSTESQRIHEELSNLIENFDKEKNSLMQNEKNYLSTDSLEFEDPTLKRRHSGGDILEKRRERLKDPKTRLRRRSIGGSLLLNAIIKSTATNSQCEDSLADALSIVSRKDELQEILKSCKENAKRDNEKDGDGAGSFDEIDGINGREPQRNPAIEKDLDALISSINARQKLGGNLSAELDVERTDVFDAKTQASVGTEMHDLLEALQELVVTGDGTPVMTPPASSQSSRRASWVEKVSPKRKESLDELEAFFKNKLEEISEREMEQFGVVKDRNTESFNPRQSDKNRFRRSSSTEQYTRGLNTSFPISHSTNEFLHPNHVGKTRPIGVRRGSIQLEGKRVNRGRSNSTFEIISHETIKENKVTPRLNASSSLPRRRKSDIPLIRQEEIALDSTAVDEAYKRALWKEDQEMFAKQVNQRLQDWLEKATALSLRKAEKQETEDDSTSQMSIETNTDSAKEEDVKTKITRFTVKKAGKGRINRSKSLHNILDPDEVRVEKPKMKSPFIERSKQHLRKLGRLRIPRSKSMQSVAALKPPFDRIETKSTESEESNDSPSSNTRETTIWYDGDSDSPERIPKMNGVVIRTDIAYNNNLFQRRRSCPTPEKIYVNNSSASDSKRSSRLPVDLPLFYVPGTDSSNLFAQKKVENVHQNSREKENKMPRVCKTLFPVKKGINLKEELFYKDQKGVTRLYPNPLTPPPTMNNFHSTSAKSSLSTSTDEDKFLMFENFDVSKLSAATDFESFEDFRDRTKSTESEDSGCPKSDYC